MKFIKKWYTYQKERFPIIIFGIYVLSIAIGVFGFVNFNTPNREHEINYIIIIPMTIVTFLQFLMVRIVDEFKDYEEDCKYRPYRPVPRGLIKLKELKILFIICALLQIIITVFATENRIKSIIYLLIMWAFFAIMSKGFFIKKILEKHILLEVLLDEIMMPLMVLYITSFMQIGKNKDTWKIIILSYIISWIVEIARKIRAKEQEEKGVKTYTAIFGIPKAITILIILETLLVIVQYMILGTNYIVPIILTYAIINIINILFIIKKNKTFAKMVETSANIYIILVYLSMLLKI